MTNPTSIETLLTNLEEARAQATQGEWEGPSLDWYSRNYLVSAGWTYKYVTGGYRFVDKSPAQHSFSNKADAHLSALVANATPALIEAFREVLGALKAIAAPSYGTELCNTKEENNEILAQHHFCNQSVARKSLARANEIASQALGEMKS